MTLACTVKQHPLICPFSTFYTERLRPFRSGIRTAMAIEPMIASCCNANQSSKCPIFNWEQLWFRMRRSYLARNFNKSHTLYYLPASKTLQLYCKEDFSAQFRVNGHLGPAHPLSMTPVNASHSSMQATKLKCRLKNVPRRPHESPH